LKTKTLSKKRLDKLWQASSSCYYSAVTKVGFSNEIIRERYLDLMITDEEALEMRGILDAEYRKNLCTLDSSTLQDLLLANDKGLQKRAKITIDAIVNELFERELNNEKKST
jgi:hypothetical protein